MRLAGMLILSWMWTGLGFADTIQSLETSQSIDFVGGFGRNSTSYLGVVTSETPLQLNSSTNTVSQSHTIAPEMDDVLGRDLRSSRFDLRNSIWNYVLNLPVDAVSGTGLFDLRVSALISFAETNYENSDDLVFELYADNTLVDELEVDGVDGGATISVDMGPFLSLSDGIREVRLQIQAGTFAGSDESFLLHDFVLSGRYLAIPEAGHLSVLSGLIGFLPFRRKRS